MTCCCIKTEKKQEIDYSNKDICPLFEATSIVSLDNVYVNTQDTTNPYLMNFDL